MFYTDIHLKTLCRYLLFSKKALATITITRISIVLFRGYLSSESSLIFIHFSSQSDFLVTNLIKSLILIHSSLYSFIFCLFSLVGTSVKYLFPSISLKHPFVLFETRYKGFTVLIFTYFQFLIVKYAM